MAGEDAQGDALHVEAGIGRRRRSGEGGDDSADEPGTTTRVRSSRTGEDQITALSGSTRLEAKKQRRREGREAGRRRAPIVSEAEFLARRESVDRVMVIREREDLMDCYEAISGTRMHATDYRPGGVYRDLPDSMPK